MLATTLIQHPLSEPDRATMAMMRAAAAPIKGKLAGPEVRPLFDTMMSATPAAAGVSYEAATVGGDELLLDDAVRYAGRLQAAGGQAELHVWLGFGHVFPASVGKLEAAWQALDLLAAFFTKHLG